MSTETTQHRFSAPVKSLGQQQRGDGWDMVLGWRLPGSKYDLHLYGQDWADVEGLGIGDSATWTIQRGNLKNEKDGKYASDYFWNWDQQATSTSADVDELFAGKPEPGEEPSEKPNTVEGVVQGHLENMAVDLYVAQIDYWKHQFKDGPIETYTTDAINYQAIREIRDSLFHQVKEEPIQPVGYCYAHETQRKQSPMGTYVHPYTDGDQHVFCTPDGLVDGTGAPRTEPHDLPF